MPSRQPSLDASGPEPLLAWYTPRRVAFPWRQTDDPYAVLVSEVMLQQTQATRVVPAYRSFLRCFPSVHALARASRAAVVRAWDGLGYNRRAVALLGAAQSIVRDHGGRVPADPEALRRLPGVGPYTSAAVASLAFGVPVAAVDTNVRRIVARVFQGREPHQISAARIGRLAERWLDRRDPGAWNQALMDLGREVCRPRPRCGICPLAASCRFRAGASRPAGRPQRRGRTRSEPFEGSHRQIRGAVVRALRRRSSATLATLTRQIGQPPARIQRAIAELVGEGIVHAGPAARAGRMSGRVRLAD